MTIRIEQGKGGKDRYTVLSRRLLDTLREDLKIARPTLWLFPSQETGKPLHPTALQRAYQQAKLDIAAIAPEEPATMLFTGLFNRELPKKGARYEPGDGAGLADDPRAYAPKYQDRTREKIGRIRLQS